MHSRVRSALLVTSVAALMATPPNVAAQTPTPVATAPASPADSSVAAKKKKKGLIGRVKDVANDKTVRSVAKTAACSGMTPASQALQMAGKCNGGGMAGGLAGGGVAGMVAGGAAEAAMGKMGGAQGAPGSAPNAAITHGQAARVKSVSTAIADAQARGVPSDYLMYLQNDVLQGEEMTTLDDAKAATYVARLNAAKATDRPPTTAATVSASANDLPLLPTESAEFAAPVSESTKQILEAAIKEAKGAGIPNSMINPMFANRKRGKGNSTKDLSEGEARQANRGLRQTTLPFANPNAARANANVQAQSAMSMMQQMTAPMTPPSDAPITAGAASSTSGGLDIQGDLTAGPVTIRGIVWPDPLEPQDRMRITQMLASQLAPIAAQLNLIGGRFKISLYAPMPSNGKNGLRERQGMLTTALAQAGVRFGQGVMLSPGKLEGAEESRVVIER